MALEAVVETVVGFVREHQSWAAPMAFLVAFGESFCFLSILWPGTAILAGIAALLAASGVTSDILMPAIIAATAGGTLGYAVSYWLGLYFKDSVDRIWPFSTRPHLITEGKAFFDKYGAFGVFLGHFFGPVRAVIPVVAGMFGMKQIPFQIANFTSAAIWAAGVIAPAFYLVNSREDVMRIMNENEIAVAVVLFLVAFANSIARPMFFVPTLLTFVGLGALHAFAKGDFYVLWAAGTAGAFVGDLYAYSLGKKHKHDSEAASPSVTGAQQHEAARASLERWGNLSVITSKLQGYNRGLVPLEAGAMERPFAPFAAVSVIASLVWAGVFLLPAALVGYLVS